jgi:starch synthase
MGQGEPDVVTALGSLAERHRGAIALKVGFDEREARCMYAGSDFLLMPSRFEPCGLSQMYAQRFGSLPIARRTGGLADSIEDGVTGFLFQAVSSDSCGEAVGRALDVFGKSSLLEKMRRVAMGRDFGWSRSVKSYRSLYARAVAGATPYLHAS